MVSASLRECCWDPKPRLPIAFVFRRIGIYRLFGRATRLHVIGDCRFLIADWSFWNHAINIRLPINISLPATQNRHETYTD